MEEAITGLVIYSRNRFVEAASNMLGFFSWNTVPLMPLQHLCPKHPRRSAVPQMVLPDVIVRGCRPFMVVSKLPCRRRCQVLSQINHPRRRFLDTLLGSGQRHRGRDSECG